MSKGNNAGAKLRKGETSLQLPARTERLFKQENYWYFKTREGMNIGPYDTKESAISSIPSIIEYLTHTQADVIAQIVSHVVTKPRKGETEKAPKRTSRFFKRGNYWYFKTREGMDIGPYDSESAALQGVKSVLGYLDQAEPEIVTRISDYLRAA